MTYRIVDVATEAQVGELIVSNNARYATTKSYALAHLAGGSFRVQEWDGAEWQDCVTTMEGRG